MCKQWLTLYPEPPEYAAGLYQEGYAKWIIPSVGVSVKRDKWPGVRSKVEIYDGDYKSDCDFCTDVLLKNGVPASAIVGENQSGHTLDNAFFSRKVIDERGLEIKSALIVCKAFPDVKIRVCPVLCYNITKDNWYKSEAGIDRVLGELTRCGNQFMGISRRICMSKIAIMGITAHHK